MILQQINVYYGLSKQNYQTEITPLIMALSTQTLSGQLDALERRLSQLLSVMENLAAENQSLREQEKKLQLDCETLHKKNAIACAQIETIIKHLKNTPPDQEE